MAPLGAPRELLGQRGLPGAGLTGDEANLTRPGQGQVKGFVELFEFCVAGDEWEFGQWRTFLLWIHPSIQRTYLESGNRGRTAVSSAGGQPRFPPESHSLRALDIIGMAVHAIG